MENASKALIIAGAILLSILIISLGIMIFSQASEVVDNNAMSDLEITQFNSKFTQYIRDNVRGAQVNSLLNQIVQNNVVNQEDTSKQVKVKITSVTKNTNWQGNGGNDGSKAPTTPSEVGKAMTGKTYDISYTTDKNTGLIDVITIVPHGTTSSQTS